MLVILIEYQTCRWWWQTSSIDLQTGETDIAQNDILGKIQFQAPDEGTGTDAILVEGGIQAISEGDLVLVVMQQHYSF